MKLSVLQLMAALFAASVQSQGADCTSVALSSIPSCAQPCFLEGAPKIGCDGLDFACQCKKEAALYAAIENCVASSCPSSEHQKVIDGAATVCECANGGSGGGQGPQVSGSSVPSASAPPPPATSAAPPPTTTSAPAPGDGEGGGGGGGGGSPTQSSPFYSATVIPGAAPRNGLGSAVYVLAAALGFAML